MNASRLSSLPLLNELGPRGTPNVSFSGCGFLGIYHVGVASCLKEYAPHLVENKISGASAGALVATALISGCCLGECTTFTLSLAMQARSRTLGPLSPSFELVKNLRQALDKFLPDNAHRIASGRLHISLTRVSDRKNILVSEFCDKNDLIDALICSSFVPLYSGILPPKYRGIRYVDGAVSSNIPMLDESTITVSPFAGESDICPDDNSCNLHHISLSGTSIQLTSNNLYRISVAFFPPTAEVLSNMCRQGFDDTLRYLKKNKLISCDRHLSIQSALQSASPAKLQQPGGAGITIEVKDPLDEMKVIAIDTENDSDNELSDSEGDMEQDCDGCEECDERERLALVEDPPVLVQSALKAVCDEVNRGFLSHIYKTKAYQAVSLMALPYLLPFEVTYTLVKKFYDWAPYLPEDMQWFATGLYALVRDMLASIKADSRLCSALAERGHVLRRWGFQWEMRCGLQLETSSAKKPTAQRRISDHRPPALRRSASPQTSSQSLNVNMGISLDYGAEKTDMVDSPLQRVSEIRRQVTEQHRVRKTSRLSNVPPLSELTDGLSSDPNPPKVRRESKSRCCAAAVADLSCDSFDECLEFAEQMDSVLAYYYADESSRTIKVVEIFPVHHHQQHHHGHSHSASHSNSAVTPSGESTANVSDRKRVRWNTDT